MMRVTALVAALLLMAQAASAQRLPTTVVPDHYSLWFAPDLAARTFRGRETIRVRVAAPTTTVTVNAAEITFGEVTIASAGRMQTARVTTKASLEQATFTVPQPLAAGEATIAIAYTGILNDKLRGFYLSTTPTRRYAVTQMEATDARRAFPSFDEPALKATFDIALMIDTGDTAISNGPVVSDTPGPERGKHTVTFKTTKKMSTYLVAMLVGDFACRAGNADGIPVRVCSTPDKRAQTATALQAAEDELRFYDQYFGIRYPFDKLDLIGIPDFAAGAMENAGAITFRERELLVDPQHASSAVRRTVFKVTAHEIAHQWFGDLVTMKWWDDIWLNEGFATWMESKAAAAVNPEWHSELWDAQDTQRALSLDALQHTRAIHTAAETPEQINELFDAIAYQKTAAVLRMIESYVGDEPFRKGVASYLRKYSYANASGADFWNEVTHVTGRPVDRIMSTFVDQPGAPLLSVRNRCVDGSSTTTLTQQRFVETALPGATSQVWTFPACFKTDTGAPRCVLMERREQTVMDAACHDTFANAASRGYYMTEYTPDAVRALGRNARTLSPGERIRFIGDEWWMVRAARHPIGVYLDVASAMSGEDTAAVWDELSNRLTLIGHSLVEPGARGAYAAWLRTRVGPTLTHLGWPGHATDDQNAQELRATLLRLVGIVGDDTEVQRQATALARRYLTDRSAVPPSVAAAVLQVAATAGDRQLYDEYLAQLSQLSAQPEEYYRFFNALAWFRDPTLVERTLAMTLTPAVRSQDAAALIAGEMDEPWGAEAAWTFVTTHWSELTSKLETFQGLPATIKGMGAFCSTRRADQMQAFFAAHPVPSSARTIEQQIERVRQCGVMNTRESSAITTWLAQAATSETPSARGPDSPHPRARP